MKKKPRVIWLESDKVKNSHVRWLQWDDKKISKSRMNQKLWEQHEIWYMEKEVVEIVIAVVEIRLVEQPEAEK